MEKTTNVSQNIQESEATNIIQEKIHETQNTTTNGLHGAMLDMLQNEYFTKIKEKEKEIKKEKKIKKIYEQLKRQGITDLEEGQFKKLLSIDKKEFESIFNEEIWLENLATITGYSRKYIDEVWKGYYEIGDRSESGESGLKYLVESIETLLKGNEIGRTLIVPPFNEQQKMFFVSIFQKTHPEYNYTIENIAEVLKDYYNSSLYKNRDGIIE